MLSHRKDDRFILCLTFSILFCLLIACGLGNSGATDPTATSAPVSEATTAPIETEEEAAPTPTVAVEPTAGGQTTGSGNKSGGDLDLSSLPKYADAEIIYEGPESTIYVTPADVASVADFSRKELAALGWQEYIPPFSQIADDPNLKMLTFKKDGQGLSAFITMAPAQDNKTSVQYSPIPLEADLPALADATSIEFSDTRPYLAYTTPSDFDTVIAFYREQLAAPDWQETEDMAIIGPEQARLVFANQSKEMAMILLLTAAGDSRTKVTLEPLTDDVLAEISGPEPTEEAEAEATEAAETTSTEMPDIPTPSDAQNVNYDAEGSAITFTSPSKIEQLVEFYRQELPAQGWEEDEMFSMIQGDTFASLEFTKDEATLSFTIFRIVDDTEVSISISGMGAPVAADVTESDDESTEGDSTETTELTAEDKDGLPVPNNYTNYSSEGSQFARIVNATVPANLADVLEFYRRELSAQGWQEQADAAQEESSSATLSFGGDKGDLGVTLTQSGDETEVKLALKDTAAAKEAGVLPPQGQARIYFGNIGEAAITFSINQQEVKVEPQDPNQSSMEGVPNLDVPPGKYEYTLTLPGEPSVTDEVEVGPNETWGLIAGPGGAFPIQLY